MVQDDNRRSRYLLQPMLQLKVGLYHLILGLCFVITLLGVLHSQWIRFRSWLELTEIRDMIDTEVMAWVQSTLMWAGSATVVFLVCSAVITVITTHRMVGPTVAFRRHLQALIDGDTSFRTTLRPHDAFQEVAEDLNRLSEAMAARAGGAGPAAPADDASEG